MKEIRAWILVLVCFVNLSVTVAVWGTEPNSITAIIGAIEPELALIKEQIKNSSTTTCCGIQFSQGILGGQKIVICLTGEGKVNAAMSTAILIAKFHPGRVIFTGIAGGLDPNLEPGDVVIGKSTTQHDYGDILKDSFRRSSTFNAFENKYNPQFFEADPALLTIAQRAAAFLTLENCDSNRPVRITTGIIATGDAFIASGKKKQELHEELGADAVEMEGAAVAQVCYQQNTPCIVIRSFSDNANDPAHKTIRQNAKTAADNSARVAISMMKVCSGVSQGELPADVAAKKAE